jgi:hypothetical protein
MHQGCKRYAACQDRDDKANPYHETRPRRSKTRLKTETKTTSLNRQKAQAHSCYVVDDARVKLFQSIAVTGQVTFCVAVSISVAQVANDPINSIHVSITVFFSRKQNPTFTVHDE